MESNRRIPIQIFRLHGFYDGDKLNFAGAY